MSEYTIRGVTYTGQDVDVVINAPDERAALAVIRRLYNSKLKKPFEIFTKVQATEELLKAVSMTDETGTLGRGRRSWGMEESDILRIAGDIRENQPVDPDEYQQFVWYCDSLTNGLLNRLWTDMPHYPKEDKAVDLFLDIVVEFLPSYDPIRGKKRIRKSLYRKVRYRIMRDWKREKYTNADKKDKSQPKAALLWEYMRRQERSIQENDSLSEKEQLIQLTLQVAPYRGDRGKFTPTRRREFFGFVVKTGLHTELLRSKRQREVLQLIYGNEMKEVDAAQVLGIKQSSINAIKNTAEQTYFKNTLKNFGGN